MTQPEIVLAAMRGGACTSNQISGATGLPVKVVSACLCAMLKQRKVSSLGKRRFDPLRKMEMMYVIRPPGRKQIVTSSLASCGSDAMYQKGCRCSKCREVKRKAMAKWRASKKQNSTKTQYFHSVNRPSIPTVEPHFSYPTDYI